MTPKEFLIDNTKKIIELQTLLTSIPAIAPEGNGCGETEKASALEKWLCKNGFENVRRIEIPDKRVLSGVRPSLIATISPCKNDEAKDEKAQIWVITHLDVVPAGNLGEWNTNPFELCEKGGVLYGRGVEDNQQGMCSSIFATLYFIKNKISLSHTVNLLFVADEENGSHYGIIKLLENYDIFHKSDLILIPDGGDKNGETIEIAEKNILWIKFRVVGKQTHASRPDSGVNACLASCALSLAIHNLESVFCAKDDIFEPNYSTFQPTKREKNVESVNIIPGEDIFYVDCRILPCYPLDDVIKKINEICIETENQFGAKIEVSFPQKSESPTTKQDSPVAQKLAAALKSVHNINAKFIGIGGGTVAAELRRRGFDAVVWSTLENQAHQINEYCKIENLIKDAETLIEMFR